MELFTRRNIAILGLLQVGVLVFGSLTAGACFKWYAIVGLTVPERTQFWADYGVLTLVLPIAWVVTGMSLVGVEAENPDTRAQWVLLSGVGMGIVWLVVVSYAAVGPLAWAMFGGCGGLSD